MEIIDTIKSKGFKQLSENTLYNYKTKIEVIIFEDKCSISNGVKKLYTGDLSKDILKFVN